MKDVSSESFAESTGKGKVIVDFWAPWCGPCKMQAPILGEVEKEFADVDFVKVNVDEEPGLASDYGVRGIPTLVFFKDGEVVERHSGVMDKASLARKCEDVFS